MRQLIQPVLARRCNPWLPWVCLVLACALSPGVWCAAAQPAAKGPGPTEYELKAAYLYHLSTYIQLPASAFPDKSSPLVLGILGEDPFGPLLDNMIKGKTVQGRPLVVQRAASAASLTNCHLVFFGTDRQADLTRELDLLKEHPVITVGQRAGFTRSGGMVNFFMTGNFVGMEVNLAAAERAGARVDYQLQKLSLVKLSRDGREAPKP
jgi:hypothetical protein